MYLYENARAGALERLRGLEQIEDEGTISTLLRLPRLQGLSCLEVGAGAGSIAGWLAKCVAPSGRVLATDIDVSHLDSSRYAVLKHDIRNDELPAREFDLVHLRHVLFHVPDPHSVLRKLHAGMRPGAHLVVGESDLRSWIALDGAAESRRQLFQRGVECVLQLYSDRGMNVRMGETLARAVRDAGFIVDDERATSRSVTGGSAEAGYQKVSTLHLARAIARESPGSARVLEEFAGCFDEPALRYQSRTTVTVMARRVD